MGRHLTHMTDERKLRLGPTKFSGRIGIGGTDEDGCGGQDAQTHDQREDQQRHARAEVLEQEPDSDDWHR